MAKKPINQLDRWRFEQLREYGCICCRKIDIRRPAEIHHIVEGYRLGHEFTIPLCGWHHRGEPPQMDMPKSHATKILGPNLRDNKKQFVGWFGSERALLEEINIWLDQNPTGDGEKRGPEENASSLPF